MESGFVEVAKLNDIPDGGAKVFNVEDVSIAVCRVEGEVYAIENRCSHDNGPLGEGILKGKCIECPRHGAQFDITTGAVVRMPAYGPIETFEVIVEDDIVYVNIDD